MCEKSGSKIIKMRRRLSQKKKEKKSYTTEKDNCKLEIINLNLGR